MSHGFAHGLGLVLTRRPHRTTGHQAKSRPPHTIAKVATPRPSIYVVAGAIAMATVIEIIIARLTPHTATPTMLRLDVEFGFSPVDLSHVER